MSTKKTNIIFLVDFEPDNFWLAKQLDNTEFESKIYGFAYSKKNRTVKWRRILLFYNYINLALRSLINSKESDIIVSWNFIVGAFAGFFCKFLFLKRTILSINMISHEKGFFNTIIRKLVYNNAFKYKKFFVTVNSEELINYYSNKFNIRKTNFFVLHDCITREYENDCFTEGNGKVFCGGEGMRDWPTLFKAAILLPSIKFIGIARKKLFDSKLVIPENVEMYFDTEKVFFYEQLKNSSLVAMPLTTLAPAGLLVMIRAALFSKPIIITQTSSTQNYIEDSKNGLFVSIGNETQLAEKITYLMSNIDIRRKLAKNMSEDIKSFSPKNYIDALMKILQRIS